MDSSSYLFSLACLRSFLPFVLLLPTLLSCFTSSCRRMARVNAEVYIAGLPARNLRAFTAIDRERAAQVSFTPFGSSTHRSLQPSFVRSEPAMKLQDVDVETNEQRFANDRTSLLLRTLKQNWKNMANGGASTAFVSSPHAPFAFISFRFEGRLQVDGQNDHRRAAVQFRSRGSPNPRVGRRFGSRFKTTPRFVSARHRRSHRFSIGLRLLLLFSTCK